MTLRVIAFADGQKNGVSRDLAVTVPKDGAWHRFAFDPAPAGIEHVFVRASVFSAVAFDVDNLFLSSPFGGV